MSENFIKEIEIRNFKCFKDFKAENFGRVNLIGGKNNIGKTALMEGIYINSNSIDNKNFLASIYTIELNREKTDLLSNVINDMRENKEEDILKNIFSFNKFIEKKNFLIKKLNTFENFELISNIRKVSFKKLSDTNYIFLLNNGKKEVKIDNFDNLNLSLIYNNSIYIENLGIDVNTLNNFYDIIQEYDREEEFFSYLKEFDELIEAFKILKGKPHLKKNGKYFELTTFGDGLKLYISIIISLLIIKNGYIYIDEIDNGIHYTQFYRLWKILLKISEEQNIQVFATTHSKEMIMAFNKAQKELEDKDSYYFEMYRNIKKDNIEIRALDIEQLEYELEHGEGFRGE